MNILKTPTEYAKLVYEMFAGNKQWALEAIFDGVKSGSLNKMPNIWLVQVIKEIEKLS